MKKIDLNIMNKKNMRIITAVTLALLTSSVFAQNAPSASNVAISGVNHVDAVLTGSYDYNDIDGHPESGTTYQWYRANDNSGTGKAAIGGATSITYTLTSSDFGKYMMFEVTPSDATDGAGTAVESSYTDYIYDYADVTRNNNYTHNVSGREDYGSYTANNQLDINIGNGDSLIIWLTFDVWNQTDIVVDPGGYFEVKGDFGANNNPDINIDGDMQVSGDLNVSQNATFNIAEGGSLDITGDLSAGDNADLNIEGDVAVDGNLDVGNNTTIDVDMDSDTNGTLTIGGDLIGGTGTTINGDGTVSVGGSVDPNVSDPGTGQINTLPIELVSFTAQFINGQVKIDWTTAAEINNDYFTIERSADGLSFETILTISGQGNSSQLVNYTEFDYSPLEGISYYRLKQTDYDGQFSYSNIVGVNSTALKSSSQVNVFPNPFALNEGILTIQVTDFNSDENISIQVIDITGRVVYESIENSGSDSFLRTVQFSRDITKGTYLVIISNNYERQINKLLVN